MLFLVLLAMPPAVLVGWALAVWLIEAPMHDTVGRARGRGEGRR